MGGAGELVEVFFQLAQTEGASSSSGPGRRVRGPAQRAPYPEELSARDPANGLVEGEAPLPYCEQNRTGVWRVRRDSLPVRSGVRSSGDGVSRLRFLLRFELPRTQDKEWRWRWQVRAGGW